MKISHHFPCVEKCLFSPFCWQHPLLLYIFLITSYTLLTSCFLCFVSLCLSCSGPDPSTFEIWALQAVSGEGLGLLPQRWRVFCYWDLKWPSQALQVGNQRNKVKFWLGGFKLMGIPYSICQKNDLSGALSQLVLFSVFSLLPPLPTILFSSSLRDLLLASSAYSC